MQKVKSLIQYPSKCRLRRLRTKMDEERSLEVN